MSRLKRMIGIATVLFVLEPAMAFAYDEHTLPIASGITLIGTIGGEDRSVPGCALRCARTAVRIHGLPASSSSGPSADGKTLGASGVRRPE